MHQNEGFYYNTDIPNVSSWYCYYKHITAKKQFYELNIYLGTISAVDTVIINT
jgi:hypothetical protein